MKGKCGERRAYLDVVEEGALGGDGVAVGGVDVVAAQGLGRALLRLLLSLSLSFVGKDGMDHQSVPRYTHTSMAHMTTNQISSPSHTQIHNTASSSLLTLRASFFCRRSSSCRSYALAAPPPRPPPRPP